MSKKTSKNTVFPLLIAVLVGACCFYVLDSHYSRTIGRMTLEGKFPVGTSLAVYFENKSGAVLSETVHLGNEAHNVIKRKGTTRLNAPYRKLWLQFNVPQSEILQERDVINIYNIQFEQPFSGLSVVSKRQLSKVFQSEAFFGDDNSFIQPDKNTGMARLELRQPLTKASLGWAVLPSLFLAFLAWLVCRSHQWRQLPAFQDMSLGNKISSHHEFDSVNGLRGLAALLVLFSHAAPGFEAVNVGIAILFVISGFLLSKPFVLDSARISRWATVETYLVKRVKRILPMYYFFVFITYVLTYQFDTALRNFIFVEASGHLWPMTQIFMFYICLPFVLLCASALARLHRLLPVTVLLAASVLWVVFMSDWEPFYNGRYFKQFYLYAFLLGVAGAYIHFGLLAGKLMRGSANLLLSVFLMVLIVLTIVWSAPLMPPKWASYFINPFWGKCLLSLIIIILTLQVKGTLVSRVIANPLFRSVGVVGFSFYLLHGLGIDLASNIQQSIFGVSEPLQRSWPLVIQAFFLTYIMALITYSYIERPFFGYRDPKS